MADELSRADLRWLLGPEYARLARKPTRLTARTSRWLHAVKSLPSPSLERTPLHVLQMWQFGVRPRLEKEGWHDYAKRLPKQEVWWYQTAAVALAQSYAEQHVRRCRECSLEDWGWLLAVPLRTPRGLTFDPDGNVKPAPEKTDETDSSPASTEEKTT